MLGKLIKSPKEVFYIITDELKEQKYADLANNYRIGGQYKRIYHVHNRKTGGTSLNHIFFALVGDPLSIDQELREKPSHRVVHQGKVFVGWSARIINRGNYFYAFSHHPIHKIVIPPDTFTFSCFRDPVQRVISHYNMLKGYQVNNIPAPAMRRSGSWLGESFDDFLERIPREYLLNQLYMFSETFNVDEALERIHDLSCYFFMNQFEEGVELIRQATQFDLKPVHTHKTSYKAKIDQDCVDRLREMMDAEYKLFEKLRAC